MLVTRQKPIHLNQETRKVWIKNSANISTLLINVFTFIFNAICDGQMKPESDEAKELKIVNENIMKMFGTNSDIAIKTAAIGAYFRSQADAGMVAISAEDTTAILHVLTHMKKHQDLIYLDSFTSTDAAKERHIKALKDLILTDTSRNMFANAKDKQNGLVTKLLEAIFKMLDMLNTPFAILVAEIEDNNVRYSGFEQQWTSIQTGLIECMDNIIMKKKNNKAKELLTGIKSETEKCLIVIQRAVAVQDVQHDFEQRLEKLREELAHNPNNPTWHDRYKRLTSYIHTLTKTPGEYDANSDVDYTRVIYDHEMAMREKYLSECEKLKTEISKEKSQVQHLQAEIDQTHLAHKAALESLRRELQEAQAANVPPPPPPYDDELALVGLEAIHQQAHAPAIVISEDELFTKQQLVAEITADIARIERKKLVGNSKDRTDKLNALNQLKNDIEATMNNRPLLEIMKEFFAKNYVLITHQRAGGLKKLFNPEKPDSLIMLERFYNPVTATINMQARPLPVALPN